MKNSAVIFFFLLSNLFGAFAQENAGLNPDNFAPVNTQFINPSSTVDAGTWLDINVVGFSTYARSNFAYLPDAYLPNPGTFKDPVLEVPSNTLYGYSADMVLGPSFSLVINKHAFGIHTAARSYLFVKKLPRETVAFIKDSTDLTVSDGSYEERRMRMKELTWEEYGFTYGLIVSQRNDEMYTAAITVNRLYGIHSAGMYIEKGTLEVDQQEGVLIDIENGNYWYSEPARLSGKGWSTSLGMTYKKTQKDISNYVPHSSWGRCELAPYRYKLGISLLDLGYIKFDQNAHYNYFDEDTPVDSIKNWLDVTEQALAQADGFDYTTILPAALSVQYDYNFDNDFYGNITLVQRITLPSWRGVERANQLAASIRYERKRFSASLPVTLHEYRYPQIGLSLRLWFFIFGTDQILPFIKKMDLYSADVYAYFKIPIFISPSCRQGGSKDKKGRGMYKKVLCPKW